MQIKFDMVRIGRMRKNHQTEVLLRENTAFLKSSLKEFLSEIKNSDGEDCEHVTIIVPGKGHNPKFKLQDFRDKRVRNLVKKRFPGFVYKGSDSTLINNIDNRIFR